MSTLIVMPDFVTSLETKLAFSHLPPSYITNNVWLILHSNLEEDKKYLFSLKRILSKQDNLQFDSQVYVLNVDRNYVKLFEVYRICDNQPLIIKQLTTFQNFTNDRNSAEFIWNRRKNLMQCQLRVAYVTGSSFKETNKTNINEIANSKQGILEAGGKYSIQPGSSDIKYNVKATNNFLFDKI